jgi:Uma2 family endonuclease
MLDYAQKILELPDAPQYIETLNSAWADEQARRHAFREWITEDMKAEFVNGQTILHSPVKRRHLNASNLLSRTLSIYASLRKLGSVMVEKAMIALTRNDYEPDIVFFSAEKTAQFTEDQMLFPAPDFVVEILSKKTAKMDRSVKKDDYAAHGIREYWIIDPVKMRVEQYLLITERDTKYFEPYTYHLEDDIQSKVIEGFEIPVKAIFDEATNLEVLQKLMP